MKPNKNKNYIEIPIAVDVNRTTINNFMSKLLWSLMLIGIFLVAELAILILASWLNKLFFSILNLIIVTSIIRYIILKERYFKKKRRALLDMDYHAPVSVMWGILEISDTLPYIHRFTDGSKAIFIRLEKGIKTGRPQDFHYENSEIIAEAYNQADREGLTCKHIDYMDNTGKDTRMEGLFEQVEEVENHYLKRLLHDKFGYIEEVMNRSYTTHDVYVFYSFESNEKFWDSVQTVIDVFLQANYMSAIVLPKEETADLVQNLMNMENFSVNQAVETIYKSANNRKSIKVIWTEKNGIQEKHNKTKEELKEEREAKKKQGFFKRGKTEKKAPVKKPTQPKKPMKKKQAQPANKPRVKPKQEKNNENDIEIDIF